MADGWIKLHRILLSKSIWECSTPEQKTILITILLSASHKVKEWEWKGERYKIQPGQFITSYEKLTKKCGKKITIQKLRTALDRFEKYEFLTYETTNKNTLVTIMNWEEYQSKEENQHSDQQADNKQITNNQQSNNNQITTIKNDKNIKNVKKEKNIYPTEIINFVVEFQEAVFNAKGKAVDEVTETLINKCCDTIDKIIRIDGFSLEEIHDCLMWATNDSFWSENILSLVPLRKKSSSTGLSKFKNIYNSWKKSGRGTKQYNNQKAVEDFVNG